MANVLIAGGGFGGVVAAESLARTLAPEHQITLISRSRRFVFYPALVRLAFGRVEVDDISYDLNSAMLSRRVRFVQAEVARVDPRGRRVTLAHGEAEGDLPYDYLVFALGRRLATERVTGFFEHAHHLLTVEAALKFGDAVRAFRGGEAVIGYCPEARLVVPVFETAFALARVFEERGERDRAHITVVSPEDLGDLLGGPGVSGPLRDALDAHYIDFLPDFPISAVTAESVRTSRGRRLDYDLLMLLPPFRGAGAVMGAGIDDGEGFVRVGETMRVEGADAMYAVGDCVSLPGPKMGHMAVLQGEVAAANLTAEIEGREPDAKYEHEMMLVVDEGGRNSIYLHKGLTGDGEARVRQGRFWGWAKWVQQKYWQRTHS